MRIAVVGSGIGGLGAAHRLAGEHEITLFEAAARLGGHTHSVDVTLDGIRHPVDTGFLVLNERTYPTLLSLFSELGIDCAPSDMSFSVSIGPHAHEWCGSNLRSLFAQPTNAISPRFWRMLSDIVRFNRQAGALAQSADDEARATLLRMPLERFLDSNGYSAPFRDRYLLPMAAAIWSCPMHRMKAFPLGSFVRFFHNHGLLQIENRPQWFTVPGGARRYVDAIAAGLHDVRTSTPVRAVRRGRWSRQQGVEVATDAGVEVFDAVVLATHTDQALSILEDASPAERAVLGAIAYQPNTAWLHTDAGLMPRRTRAWAAWNYLSDGHAAAPSVSVTYWLNRLQPLPFDTPVFVSLNPLAPPEPSRVIGQYQYEHPVFDARSMDAQRRLGEIQGNSGVWFAGAWTGYGFHEDGLKSGQAVAESIMDRARCAKAA